MASLAPFLNDIFQILISKSSRRTASAVKFVEFVIIQNIWLDTNAR